MKRMSHTSHSNGFSPGQGGNKRCEGSRGVTPLPAVQSLPALAQSSCFHPLASRTPCTRTQTMHASSNTCLRGYPAPAANHSTTPCSHWTLAGVGAESCVDPMPGIAAATGRARPQLPPPQPHTRVDEDVSLEVVAAPKGSIAVLADEVLGDAQLERAILLDHHHLQGTRGWSTPGPGEPGGKRQSPGRTVLPRHSPATQPPSYLLVDPNENGTQESWIPGTRST